MDPQTLSSIKSILLKYPELNDKHIFIYGSRATGKNRKYSDIDLGIEGNQPLSATTYVSLQQDFVDSDIPFTIDVVDFNKTSDTFKSIAKSQIIPIHLNDQNWIPNFPPYVHQLLNLVSKFQ